MTVLFIDGWDHYDDLSEKYDLTPGVDNTPDIVTTDGRFTNGSVEIQNLNTWEIVKFIDNSSEVIMGNALKFDASNQWIVRFQDEAGTILGTHELGGTGGKFWRGNFDSGTLLGTYAGELTTDTWQYLECRYLPHATAGEVEVRVNGVVVLSLTGINSGTTTPVGRVFIRSTGQAAGSVLLDDMYILNTEGPQPQNTFLGDVRVTALLPTANGNNNNFTPTGAPDNFDAVNEPLANKDLDFVESGQLGAREDYDNQEFSDVGFNPGNIYAVQVVNSAKKTDAGALHYKNQMVIAGTTFDDGTEVVATSVLYKMTTFISDLDPSDGFAWTEAKVAVTGSGYEITFKEV